MFILAASLLTAPCNSHPEYALQPIVSYGPVTRAGSVYRASAHLRFRLIEKTPALIPSVDPGLLDHVQGHYIIARRVAQSSTGSVQSTGNTAALARTRVRQAIARVTSDAQSELLREERVYESVTENGAAQSQGPQYGFPGGPDAHEICAQQ